MNRSAAGPAPMIARETPQMTRARLARVYLEEARAECLRYLRMPSFMLPTLLFPTVFYAMFGILLGHANSADAPRYLLASYGTFGVMAPGLYGFGVSLALERENGLLTLKRAMPMPPGAYLAGKMVMAVLMVMLIALLLMGMAVGLAHVSLNLTQAASFLLVAALGVLPFAAMGFWLGTLIKGQGAPGLINLIYLPMSFLSGLWFPLSVMPKFLQQIAPVWPGYQLDQLALAAVGMGNGAAGPHVLVLMVYAAVFLLLAARRLRRYG